MKTGITLLVLALLGAAAPPVANGQIVDDSRRIQAVQHYRSGQELLFAEQFAKAEEEFAQAIDLDPLLTLAYYGRGQALMALKRYPSAVQAYIGCREAHRKIFTMQQSNTAELDRRAEEEIRELKDTATALRSGRIKFFGGVGGSVDTRVAQIEARIRDLERLRQMDTGTFHTPAEVSLALGSAYFRKGDTGDAEREWKAAIEVNSRLGEAHNNLAVIYMLSNRRKEADDAIRAAERSGFRVNPQLKEDIRAMRE